jgi:nucleoid-associated protein YgaU
VGAAHEKYQEPAEPEAKEALTMGRHSRVSGRHRAPSQTGRTAARIATAGVAIAGPLVASGQAEAGPGNGWAAIIACESGGQNIPNAVSSASGIFQIIDGTWRDYGGESFAPRAMLATKDEQTIVAERIYAARGLQPWESSRACWASGKHASGNEAPRHVPRTTPRHAKPGKSYTVKRGDTLGSIAEAHGTTWRALYAANRGVIDNPHLIHPGDRLHV